jgi:hypothetical protein
MPFDVSIAARLFKNQDLTVDILSDTAWLKQNNIQLLFITTGDTTGKKLSELNQVVEDSNMYHQVFGNKAAIIYQPNYIRP